MKTHKQYRVTFYMLLSFVLLTTVSCNHKPDTKTGTKVEEAIPTLDELAGEWMAVKTLRNFPSVNNFYGGLQTTQNLTAFKNMTLPPFAQAYAQGGMAFELLLDGKSLDATKSKWLPYEVRRKTEVNNVLLESAIRMPFEQNGMLLHLTISNQSTDKRTVNVSINDLSRLRKYATEEWNRWDNLRPWDTSFVAKVYDNKTLMISDKLSSAYISYTFTQTPDKIEVNNKATNINWEIVLAPGESKIINCAFAVDVDSTSVLNSAKIWASDFNKIFDNAKTKWEERWQAAFIPDNKHFSGHFPTLVTNDAKVKRVYYHSALVPMLLCRTNLPISKRCFVTASPQWATTLTYFWDSEMWANIWAMLEPKEMKELIIHWLSVDYHQCYAVDCMTGNGAGPWYGANDWSIFKTIEAYLNVTGDTSFLNIKIKDKTVLQHLNNMATYYQSRPLTEGNPLADYGTAENLLECSPSYIHGVPSLNAANVYMLRKTAEYYKKSGNPNRAKELLAQAEKLLPAVLSLYEPGQGVWSAIDTNGHKVPLRHCFDYIMIGQSLDNDLTDTIKNEMNNFVNTELRTKSWMRAMSFKDPAALQSDRPDHGPMGSYDGWPPLTMDVMCRFGNYKEAIDFLRATETLTHEGPWSQSHEFLGDDSRGYNPVVRVANRGGQDNNSICGATFADVIVRSFFGFQPELFEDNPKLLSPNTPRDFNGQLLHIPFNNGLYSITSNTGGVKITKEH